MLQKVDKERLDNVLEVLKKKQVRFPVAFLTKELEADKGMVSNYLNGKKPISDKFYSTFVKKFGEPAVLASTGTEIEVDDRDISLRSLAEANLKWADAHIRLVALLEKKFIESASPKTDSYTEIAGPIALRLLALVASRNKFRTVEEAEAALAQEIDAMIEEKESALTRRRVDAKPDLA